MSTADDDIGYLVYSNVAKLMIVLLVLGVVWYGFMETTSFDEFAANLNVSILQFITFYRFIFPLVDDIEYNLIVGVYLPFFYKSPSMYPLAYMLSVLFFIYISHFVMVTDLKMQTHLIHLLCQFAVLGDCFENMIPDCMAGFEGQSVVECMTSFLFLAYNLFDFYMICRWCQEITNQSANVGEAIYCSGWECGVSKLPGVRSTIMFVIARANKPLVLTAGGMYDLSLTSYTSVS
ncbi:hypothetical protein HF086_017123 [Spodoptera exigua]|uniref:Uncharacterized protein n=1 Tax=Spodoptera exigua TaxID=7107 RepID=A0A922M445_SPOEX|nr:hypothetical protein HF086_017123 [Spodoptera exigua]